MKVSHFLFCMIVIGGFIGCTNIHSQKADWKTLEKVFVDAPDSIQTSVYWYWISDNLSKQGVVNDLHAMKKVGINRAFISNIGLNDLPDGSYGSVKIFTDEWWEDKDLFVDYLKRCNFLLTRGWYVADVICFIAEDAPKMICVQDPAFQRDIRLTKC